jgi:hypothetical protein
MGLSVGLLAAALVCCGGSEEGNPSGSGGSTGGPKLSEVPAMWTAAYCDIMSTCLGAAFDIFMAGQDCTSRLLPGVQDGSFAGMEAAVQKGTIVYDGTKVQACIAALKAQGCGVAVKRDIPECVQALSGTVALGGECTLHAECTGDAYCKGDSCPGKCAPREASGVACRADEACRDGMKCAGGKCLAPAGVDGACMDNECDITMICLGADEAKQEQGSCKLISEVFKAKDGETCDLIETMLLCEPGLACSLDTLQPVAFKCQPLAASGATCKLGAPNTCPAGEYCAGIDLKAVPPKTEGTCTKLPGDGQPCQGKACAPEAVCDASSVCRIPQRIGASCPSDKACYSENCVSGVCEAGNACTP